MYVCQLLWWLGVCVVFLVRVCAEFLHYNKKFLIPKIVGVYFVYCPVGINVRIKGYGSSSCHFVLLIWQCVGKQFLCSMNAHSDPHTLCTYRNMNLKHQSITIFAEKNYLFSLCFLCSSMRNSLCTLILNHLSVW